MAALSLIFTVVSLFTFWLVVPMFVLPPLAFVFGYKAYRAKRASIMPLSRAAWFWSIMPMALAVAAFFFEMYVFGAGYRA